MEEYSLGASTGTASIIVFDDLGLRMNETFRTELIARLPEDNPTEDQVPSWARSQRWTGVFQEAP